MWGILRFKHIYEHNTSYQLHLSCFDTFLHNFSVAYCEHASPFPAVFSMDLTKINEAIDCMFNKTEKAYKQKH